MNKLHISKFLTLSSIIGIGLILIYWYGKGLPYTDLPLPTRATIIAVLIIPLLFPLSGLIKNSAHTFKWSSLLCLLYFIHGTMELWANPLARWLAMIELILSLVWFVFAIVWVRANRLIHRGQTPVDKRT